MACLCECVRLIVKKKAKTVGRERKEKKTHTQLQVSFECRKRNYAAKETKYKIRFISEYYVTIT